MNFKEDDDHHWNFLEEIEAPMWADLTIKDNTIHHDIDEKWLLVSHPIHQRSASQIKAAYKQSKKGKGNLQGPSSPKLPSSVSRSRGKDYRSEKWGCKSTSFLSTIKHPINTLGGKTMKVGSGPEAKLKSNGINSIIISSSKSSKDCESNSTQSTITNNSKTVPSSVDFHHVAIEAGESKSTSTVTSVSGEQQKLFDVIGQTVGGTSGLLSAMRMALRKSCVTRQASRAEINDGRRVIGRKSSSGKSSVGSSSSLGYIVSKQKLTRRELDDKTPDSRSVAGFSQSADTKGKLDIAKASISRSTYCTNPKGGTVIPKSAHQGTAKSKLICQPTNRKALLPRRVNEQGQATASIKAGAKVTNINNCLLSGKENPIAIKAGAEEKVIRIQPTEPKKVGKNGMVASKHGKAGEFERKSSGRVIHKVHFR